MLLSQCSLIVMAFVSSLVFVFVAIFSYTYSLESIARDYCTQQDCPPWMIESQGGSNKCTCRERLPEYFSCSEGITSIDISYCMSFDNGTVLVGVCPYIHQNMSGFLVELPAKAFELNSVFCDPLNREGSLCHQCKEGFGVAPLSLEFVCVECHDTTWPWWVLFLCLEFIPVTIFYFINLVCQVSFARAPFKCFIFVSQISFWTMANVKSVIVIRNKLGLFGRVFFDAVKFLNGIWSLDFFSVFPPFCISTYFNSIHLLYVWYLAALYPLFLVFLTFVVHKLHDRNFKPIIYLWRPFRRCFIVTRQVWDRKTSIVNVFSNFCLFSLSKILLVVTTTFQWSTKSDMCEPGQSQTVLWVEPAVSYPDPGLFLLSLVFSIVTVTVIVLCACYPLKHIQLCLRNCCSMRLFKAFFEIFVCSYKDGTGSSKYNLQYLSALYPALQVVLLICSLFLVRSNIFLSYMLISFLLFSVAMFVVIVRPYKKSCDSVIEALLLFLLGLVTGSASLYIVLLDLWLVYVCLSLAAIPQVVFVVFVGYKVYQKSFMCCKKTCVCCNKCFATKKEQVEEFELPDRIVNADEYKRYY